MSYPEELDLTAPIVIDKRKFEKISGLIVPEIVIDLKGF